MGRDMRHDYELRIRGRLSSTLINEFTELSLSASVEPVETVLAGPVRDQAALHGLIRRIEALGLELVELRRLPDRYARSETVTETVTETAMDSATDTEAEAAETEAG
jgi:hypothetical protein